MALRVYEARFPNGNYFRFYSENLELAGAHLDHLLTDPEFVTKFGGRDADLIHLGFNANVNDDRY